jgi:DNA-binding NtrC family response regulator
MPTTSDGARKLNVLVVDNEELIADSLVQILNMAGFNACSLYNGSDAISQAAQKPYDVLICDVVMNGITGIDVAIEICKVLPNCKVLLFSGNIQTSELLEEAHERGHDFDILAKPVHPTVIIDMLNDLSVVN